MDFKGPKRRHADVGPLSVLDDHSRYLIALERLEHARGAVREQLESAFQRCGVPEAMLMDHGTPWWSMRSAGGMTELSLWLMRQGIGLHWSRIRHPQTQGKVERFHGELQRALAAAPQEPTRPWLDGFRWEHNYVRPHEALGWDAGHALAAQPAALRSAAAGLGVSGGAWVRKIDGEGKLDVGGRNWQINQCVRGEQVQLVKIEHRVQVYYCRTLIRELDLANQQSTIVDRWLSD